MRYILLLIVMMTIGCQGQKKEYKQEKLYEVVKTNDEWKEILTPDQYYILRRSGTERAFSHELNYEKREGYYVCAADSTILFTSVNKFDSGTGWPSFTGGNNLEYEWDGRATEVRCITCGGHLGHLFHDIGPGPDKARYCINGAALMFNSTEQ